MAYRQIHFSDDERERLRKALGEYAAHFDLSPQQLADRIAEATGYALDFDAGRKRIERFLKGTHRHQSDDFVGAIAAYLGTVPPPDIEQMAASLAHFFARQLPRPVRIDELTGRYRAWIGTDRRPESYDGISQMTMFDGFGFEPMRTKPMKADIAYAVITMRPFAKSDALMVSEAIINDSLDPGINSFPDRLPPFQDAGIIVPFGYSDRQVPRYLMTTRTMLETRLYRLYRIADDPLTLRGELYFSGAIGRDDKLTHSDPLHPDYGVELVKADDLADH